MDARPTRFLLQRGKSVRKTLNRLLKGAHRAGFLVVPRRGAPVGEDDLAIAAGKQAGALCSTAAIERRGWRFDLDYRDYPKGIVVLDVTHTHYPGDAPLEAVEFILRQGPPLLLERLLALIATEPALLPARLTDSDRAALAAGNAGSVPRSAPGHHLGLRSRWQDLGLAHIRVLTADLDRYEPRAWESLEPEGVHQMRVTSRRLREALRAFGAVLPEAETAALKEGLRWLCGALGAVRDLDVQLGRLATLTPRPPPRFELFGVSPQPPAAPGEEDEAPPNAAVAGYRKHLRKHQRRAHRALVEALGSPRWPAIRRELDALLTRALEMPLATTDPTIRDAGSEMLERMLARVLRAGERARADDDPARLHRLRIGAKRLRYFLEYVVPVSGPEVVAGIQALSRLQDILGEHQDACVARQSLLDYRDLARLSGWERKALRRLVRAETAKVEAARAAFRAEWPTFVAASDELLLC